MRNTSIGVTEGLEAYGMAVINLAWCKMSYTYWFVSVISNSIRFVLDG